MPTNEEYYALFQANPLGLAIFQQLCKQFYTKETFDKDPYQHAYNAGARSVITYIINRAAETKAPVEPPTEQEDF